MPGRRNQRNNARRGNHRKRRQPLPTANAPEMIGHQHNDEPINAIQAFRKAFGLDRNSTQFKPCKSEKLDTKGVYALLASKEEFIKNNRIKDSERYYKFLWESGSNPESKLELINLLFKLGLQYLKFDLDEFERFFINENIGILHTLKEKELSNVSRSSGIKKLRAKKSVVIYQITLIYLYFWDFNLCQDISKKQGIVKNIAQELQKLIEIESSSSIFSVVPDYSLICFLQNLIILSEELDRLNTDKAYVIQMSLITLLSTSENSPGLSGIIKRSLKYNMSISEGLCLLASSFINILPDIVIKLHEGGLLDQACEVRIILNIKSIADDFYQIVTGGLAQKQIPLMDSNEAKKERMRIPNKLIVDYGILGLYKIFVLLELLTESYYEDKGDIKQIITSQALRDIILGMSKFHNLQENLYQFVQPDWNHEIGIYFEDSKILVLIVQLIYLSFESKENALITLLSEQWTVERSLENSREEKIKSTLVYRDEPKDKKDSETRHSSSASADFEEKISLEKTQEEAVCSDAAEGNAKIIEAFAYTKRRDYPRAISVLLTVTNLGQLSDMDRLDAYDLLLKCYSMQILPKRKTISILATKIKYYTTYAEKNWENFSNCQNALNELKKLYKIVIKGIEVCQKRQVSGDKLIAEHKKMRDIFTTIHKHVISRRLVSNEHSEIDQQNLADSDYLAGVNRQPDIEQVEALKDWAAWWSENVVKVLLGSNVDQRLVEIHIDSLKQSWGNFIVDFSSITSFMSVWDTFRKYCREIRKQFPSLMHGSQNGNHGNQNGNQGGMKPVQWLKEQIDSMRKYEVNISRGLYQVNTSTAATNSLNTEALSDTSELEIENTNLLDLTSPSSGKVLSLRIIPTKDEELDTSASFSSEPSFHNATQTSNVFDTGFNPDTSDYKTDNSVLTPGPRYPAQFGVPPLQTASMHDGGSGTSALSSQQLFFNTAIQQPRSTVSTEAKMPNCVGEIKTMILYLINLIHLDEIDEGKIIDDRYDLDNVQPNYQQLRGGFARAFGESQCDNNKIFVSLQDSGDKSAQDLYKNLRNAQASCSNLKPCIKKLIKCFKDACKLPGTIECDLAKVTNIQPAI